MFPFRNDALCRRFKARRKTMQLKSTLLAATVLLAPLCFSGAAFAQLNPGDDVIVGPVAGGQVLLYPGGKYQRVLPPLLQPGDPYPGATLESVHLHKAYRHRVVHAAPKAASVAAAVPADTTTQPSAASDNAPAPDTSAAPSDQTAPATPPAGSAWRRKHGSQAQVATTAPETGSAIPFSMDPDALPLAPPAPAAVQPQAKQAANPHTAPKAAAKLSPPPPQPAATAAQPMRVASLGKSETGDHANLTKRGVVQFDKGAPDPVPAQYHGVQLLAGDLNSALAAGAARIQLEAYGGAPGDKSSDARRLSLKRALAVRQLLIDDGVPSSRIDVRAMGGADDNGAPDRVDVFVRAG
jgi:outer membrane protein OmpA-like peptidoglycan-associated protein